MTPEVVLRIIQLLLEIILEVIKGVPIASRQAVWERHEKRVEFWNGVFEKLFKKDEVEPPPQKPV